MTPRMQKLSAALVDDYAALKAAQAALAAQEANLKAKLFLVARRDADGLLVAESPTCRLTISEVPAAEVFDADKAKRLLSDAALAECVKLRAASLRYLCKAKVAAAKAA